MTNVAQQNKNKSRQNSNIEAKGQFKQLAIVCSGENGYNNPTPPLTELSYSIVYRLSRQSDAQLVPVRTFRLEPFPYAAGRVGQIIGICGRICHEELPPAFV